MWLGLYPKQVQMEWQHSKGENSRVQRWWKHDMRLEEKIEEMLKEESREGLIPNCRTMYPIENCRVLKEDNLMLNDYNQISPIYIEW